MLGVSELGTDNVPYVVDFLMLHSLGGVLEQGVCINLKKTTEMRYKGCPHGWLLSESSYLRWLFDQQRAFL